jgi:hypothetical protein
MKSIFEEIGFDHANKLMADAIARAARETAALGLPEAVKIDGAWSARFPDGRVLPLSDYLALDEASR